ncbi:MAG: nucleotide exchange factor GrpE [Azospirillum brasilense]|nr:MAG: nucleotide exchange factor GrpE [Azospirillum brasilense]
MTEPLNIEQPEQPQTEATSDAEAGPEAMARALQALLEQKESELAAMKDQALRALADAENTRRRAEREVADSAKYAVSSFARDLVNVLENLQRATDAISPELRASQPAVASLATGVEMTLQELLQVFERHGIKRINPVGEKFDHNLHQAVAQVEAADAEAGTVVQVLAAGYSIHDRLLRPAMVSVATANNSAGALNTQA